MTPGEARIAKLVQRIVAMPDPDRGRYVALVAGVPSWACYGPTPGEAIDALAYLITEAARYAPETFLALEDASEPRR